MWINGTAESEFSTFNTKIDSMYYYILCEYRFNWNYISMKVYEAYLYIYICIFERYIVLRVKMNVSKTSRFVSDFNDSRWPLTNSANRTFHLLDLQPDFIRPTTILDLLRFKAFRSISPLRKLSWCLLENSLLNL